MGRAGKSDGGKMETTVFRHQLKKVKKKREFLCSHFNIEDERQYVTFSAYYALLF